MILIATEQCLVSLRVHESNEFPSEKCTHDVIQMNLFCDNIPTKMSERIFLAVLFYRTEKIRQQSKVGTRP